jgi:hypothetical protein
LISNLIWQERFSWLVALAPSLRWVLQACMMLVSREDIDVLAAVGGVLLLYGGRQGLLLYLISSSPLKKYRCW